jgi:hypothetical protein
MASNCFKNMVKHGCFCNGTRRDAVPEVLSHKDANQNGIPGPFFRGIDITNTPLLDRILCHYAFRKL